MLKIFSFVLYAIGFAMGIASVVLTALDSVEIKNIVILLGIGLFCVGVAGVSAKGRK
jgi:hypothetical protein